MPNAVFGGRRRGSLPLRPAKRQGDGFDEMPEGDIRIGPRRIANVYLTQDFIAFGFRFALA